MPSDKGRVYQVLAELINQEKGF